MIFFTIKNKTLSSDSDGGKNEVSPIKHQMIESRDLHLKLDGDQGIFINSKSKKTFGLMRIDSLSKGKVGTSYAFKLSEDRASTSSIIQQP